MDDDNGAQRIFGGKMSEITEYVGSDLYDYKLMCLADLEIDYINPFDSSSRINRVVMPEFIVQALLSVLFLLCGHWAMFLLSAPMVYYNYTLLFVMQMNMGIEQAMFAMNLTQERKLQYVQVGLNS